MLVCFGTQGFDRDKQASSIRTGCKAMIMLLRTSDHAWFISKVCDSHNHVMSEGYLEKKQWRSHNVIDSSTKHYIQRLRENNVSMGSVFSIINISKSNPSQHINKEVIRSLCAKISRDNMKDDIGKTLKLLDEMKSRDPGMSVRFKLDADGVVLSMLWCTGKNKEDYKYFGDAISFDTTYRTNLYSLPFGLFVGINNHFQTIVFGGVLLTSETSEDFKWAFSNFVEVMSNSHPRTILTDQCAAMAKAIRAVFPNTAHRWCRWHVLKSAKKKLGKVYSNNKFKSEFNELISNETDKDKFEECWASLISRHKLKKSRYLKRLYKYRERWAKPYFMDVFCAGMTSTQRSESTNHMVKQYIQRAAPMHMFVSKFNEFVMHRNLQEGRERHWTKMVSRKLRVGVPIEEHAQSLYTRAMYERFYDELFESGKFAIISEMSNSSYLIGPCKIIDDDRKQEFVVTMEGDEKITCTCGLFEHLGMICRHSLKVLVHFNKDQIPQGNIMKRWTKEAAPISSAGSEYRCQTDIDDMKKKALLYRTMQIVNGAEDIDEARFAAAMEALSGIPLNYSDLNQQAEEFSDVNLICEPELPKSLPERTLKGGRPPSSGLKAWLKSNEKRKKVQQVEALVRDWPDEENPPEKKTRRLRDLV